MIESSVTPTIAPGLIWRVLDDDAVVVSPTGGEVRVLNGIGTVIWRLLAENKHIDEIVDHLVSHYRVSSDQAQTDLEMFMNDLKERDMIVWDG